MHEVPEEINQVNNLSISETRQVTMIHKRVRTQAGAGLSRFLDIEAQAEDSDDETESLEGESDNGTFAALALHVDVVPNRILDSFIVEEDTLAKADALDSTSSMAQLRWDDLEHAESLDVLHSIANNIRLRYKRIPLAHNLTISGPIVSMPEDPPIWRVHVKVSVERYSYLSCFRSKYRKAVEGM
jgi:hypothetical protein